MPLNFIFISVAIGRQAYDTCDIFLYRKAAVAIYSPRSVKQQRIFYLHFPTHSTVHTTSFDRPVVNPWLEQKIAQTANPTAVQDQSGDPNSIAATCGCYTV